MSSGDTTTAVGRSCDWCDAGAVEGRVVRGSEQGRSAGAVKAFACGRHLHLLEPAATKRKRGT